MIGSWPDEDEYTLLSKDQRVFGAGIKRKRVAFVPSAPIADKERSGTLESASESTYPSGAVARRSVADGYLSLVLPHSERASRGSEEATTPNLTIVGGRIQSAEEAMTPDSHRGDRCHICGLPTEQGDDHELEDGTDVHPGRVEARKGSQQHDETLAHQVCLAHSSPPSHIDRRRKGLRYLSTLGWDPDARRGLGSQGQGIREPIKTNVKWDKLGVGMKVSKEKALAAAMKRTKERRLGAKEVRKMEEREKQGRAGLMETFYGNSELEKYLGTGGNGV
ncbi:MAG: hypothetical protein M1825_005663 [Sarcosagium campestre]|nr:MAG: hypothetical protein M1825_005663 [Sarcosagium campestre]